MTITFKLTSAINNREISFNMRDDVLFFYHPAVNPQDASYIPTSSVFAIPAIGNPFEVKESVEEIDEIIRKAREAAVVEEEASKLRAQMKAVN